VVNHKSKIHIHITAGGTREYIDPVRFISNASSGRMGHALAQAALKAGHKVTLITTVPNSRLKTKHSKLAVVSVETTAQMFAAVKEHFPTCDCLIMTAAVADFTPVRRSRIKIKKQAGKLTLALKPTPDILKWAGRHRRVCTAHRKPQIVVGFALEDRNVRANAEQKMRSKHLDMVIANTPAAIGAKSSTLHIKTCDSDWLEISNANKTSSARRIIRLIETSQP
jgi:phosphopantothenoylcysteine decarboxylase/phosphopantothenate--cysteine ligase